MQYAWTPPAELVKQSNLTAFLGATGQADYDALAAKAEADPAWLMEEVFKFCDVRFYRRYDQMLDVSRGQPWARWCVGGTTNMVLNCIDKHRDTAIWHQTFLVWEGEDRRERRSLTYAEFAGDVDRLASGLRHLGIGKGDVVAIYMPNLPETFVGVLRDPQARRHRHAAVFRVRARPNSVAAEPWRGQGRHHRQWDMATRCTLSAQIGARQGFADGSVRPARDRCRSRQHRGRHTHARRARSLVERHRRRQRGRSRHGRNAGRRSGHPALHVRHDRRTQRLHMDPYRLHRLDGHARHDHLWRLQIDRPLFLLQRHGLDGRRDVRLHSELYRRQPPGRGGHAGLSRHRPILAPDRRAPRHLSRASRRPSCAG